MISLRTVIILAVGGCKFCSCFDFLNTEPQYLVHFLISVWSVEGCSTNISYNEEKGETEVECFCDHLTSFAVLMVIMQLEITKF